MKLGKIFQLASRIIALAFVLFSSFAVFNPSNVSAAGWLSGWNNRIQLTINHTKVSSTLTNFPVMIHISSSSGTNGADVSAMFSALGSNSQKLAVTGADGTTQNYVEIVRWDSTNKQANLWVKVPSVSSTVDTVLYLYYDNGQTNNTGFVGPTGSAAAQNVWDKSFVAVWHLAQSGNGGAGEFIDSTANRYNGQGGSGLGKGTPTVTTSGTPMGVAQSFNGNNNYISVPDANAFSVTTTGQLTVSAWMSPSVVNQPTSTGGYTRWLGKSASGGHEWQFVYYDQSYSSRSQWISFYNYSASGGLGAGDYSTGNFPANSWVYVTGTSVSQGSASGNEWVYRNAAVHSGNPDSWQSYGLTYTNGSTPVTIGTGWLGSGNFFAGRIGEVRVSNVSRSTAWIAASYYAESDALVSYGTPQSGSGSTVTPPSVTTNAANSITTGGATLNGNLSSLGTASSVGVSFQYGTTTSYGSTTPVQTKTTTGTFNSVLSGLTPGTTYHYRAVATGDGTSYGLDQTFTTASSTTSSPPSGSSTFGLNGGDSVYPSSFLNAQRFQNTAGTGTLSKLEVLVSDTTSTANLRLGVYADNNGQPGNLLLDAGSVRSANGWVGISGLNLPVTSGAYYWLAFLPQSTTGIAYQSTGMPSNSHDCYSYPFGSLPGTCTIGDLNSTPFVMRATMSTSATVVPPSVTTNIASGITTGSATLNGNLSSLGTATSVGVSFQYGTTTSYGSTTTVQTKTTPGTISSVLSGLIPGTVYHYRAVASGDGTSYGLDQTFTTAVSTTPPPPSSSSTFGLNNGNAVYVSSFLNAQRFQNTAGTGTLSKLEVLVSDTTSTANLR
ncbi:MAG: hypothetical protein Q7R50_04715, partial [Dehalococcoidales bacterium]|nr:hypothetical protein [Dehalococcoidales bacterium]